MVTSGNISGWEKNRRKGPEREGARCGKTLAQRPGSLERDAGRDGEEAGATAGFLTTRPQRPEGGPWVLGSVFRETNDWEGF